MLKFLRSKKFIVVAIVIVVILLGSKFFSDSKKTSQSTVVVERFDMKEELTLSGKIDADNHVVLRFEVAGRLNWIGVREGDLVKKGQAIATLEKEKLEASLRQAQQDFTAAKAASDKYYDGRTGASESYDQKVTRTALDATQNKAYDSIRIAQENLKSSVLYSPIDGLVVGSDPNLAGVNVTTSNSSYEIINPATIYLKVTADQTEVGNLREGGRGIIRLDSYPEEEIEGVIEKISFTPTKDETGTVYDVKVVLTDVSNNNYKYRLGMTADADFVVKEKKNVLVIPVRYIQMDDKGKYVLIGKNKRKVYVKTGIENNNDVEITDGLSEGEVVYD